MLQVQFIKENKERVIKGLSKKHIKNAKELVETAISLDEQRRAVQTELDNSLAESNKISKQIGLLMKEGKRDEAETAKQQTFKLKEQSKELSQKQSELDSQLLQTLYKIPNVPNNSVPEGKSEKDNIVLSEHGEIKTLTEGNAPHWELIKEYDIIDFDLGNKITGAGFPVYKGQGAKLQRALINFFLDQAIDAGYQEVTTPILVNEASGYGTGQLPDKDGQMYYASADNLYLIPTAEVPITNIYRDVILQEKELPIKHVGYSPCFRREAGSWGADVRGLNRLHQFDKVEIIQITHPDNSYSTLENMKSHVAMLLDKLELPYRLLNLCGGDISFTAAVTFDFEVYSAAQERWLEVSSVSNFENYQANRLKLRYKDENKKSQLLHTLNGSALALPRILAALLENNQTKEGIKIPKALQSYTGFDLITK